MGQSSIRKMINWSMQTFESFDVMKEFIEKVKELMPNPIADEANANFKIYTNRILSNPRHPKISYYGMFGKQPTSYEDAMARERFVYYEEYKEVKQKIEKLVREELQRTSTAEIMQPKFVYNDKQLGEFMFDKAAMSLIPKTYYYSFVYNREVDVINEPILREGNVMVLKSDGTVVDMAIRVTKSDGTVEFVKVDPMDASVSLEEARKKGVVDCTSTNKKVFLYKEKVPKTFNAVKIIVGLTATAGFTKWYASTPGRGGQREVGNDFFTGMTAVAIMEILESLGYSIQIELVLGGGRCGGCYRQLNFNRRMTDGRRFIGFTVKPFDSQVDMDSLLYTICDPSFHNIKFLSMLNYFFTFYGDEIDTNRGYNGRIEPVSSEGFGNPASTFHGIEPNDMVHPIGMYYKSLDAKKGNDNLLHFYVNRVASLEEAVIEVRDIILTAEDLNMEAAEKFKNYDFSDRVE